MSEVSSIIVGANTDNIFCLTPGQVSERLRSPATRFSEAVMKYLKDHPDSEPSPEGAKGVPAVATAVARARRAVSTGSFHGLDPRGLVKTLGNNGFREEDFWPCLGEWSRDDHNIPARTLGMWRIMSGFRIEESYVPIAREAGFSVVPASEEQDAIGIDCIVDEALFDIKSSTRGAKISLKKGGGVPRILFVPPFEVGDFAGGMMIGRERFGSVLGDRPVAAMTRRAISTYFDEIAA